MMVKTVCQPDCPNRAAECHAYCEKYRAAWEENQRRYAENAKNRVFDDIKTVAVDFRMRQMHKKQKQI